MQSQILMEASALRISHYSSISTGALLSTNKHWKSQFAFAKAWPSVNSHRRLVVKNVASKKQTQNKWEDSSPSIQETQGSQS